VGIGDELMVTGQVREIQRTDPRRVRIEYEKGKPRWCPLWDRNPRIVRYGERGDFQVLRPRSNYLRPYCVEKTVTRWTWKAYKPPVGEIYLANNEIAFGDLNSGKIVLGPSVKIGASPNKQWGIGNWQRLAVLLLSLGVEIVQCGESSSLDFPGVRFIKTTIREAAALLSYARVVICGEGALHHIAAAVGTPAVVIYGGYISPEVTGYDGQVGFFRGGGLGCGSRFLCNHCAQAMASIRPEEVFDAAKSVMR
jgi:ADP-heptose:LPS heptosyltransferase